MYKITDTQSGTFLEYQGVLYKWSHNHCWVRCNIKQPEPSFEEHLGSTLDKNYVEKVTKEGARPGLADEILELGEA